MLGHLLYTWNGSATSSLGGRVPSGPVFLLERRRSGRRTTPIRHQGLCLGYVLLSGRWPPSSLRCRRRRSNRISYREARPSARTRRRRTRPWPGCPAPCSIKGVEVAWRSGRLLTRANLDLLRGPTPFSSVWKSNFGLWPNSLVDFHAGSRAVREIRPGHVPGVSLHQSRINATTTGAAVGGGAPGGRVEPRAVAAPPPVGPPGGSDAARSPRGLPW